MSTPMRADITVNHDGTGTLLLDVSAEVATFSLFVAGRGFAPTLTLDVLMRGGGHVSAPLRTSHDHPTDGRRV